jgi:hypothetical protein
MRLGAGSAADSYLWHKVDGTHLAAGGAGARMPPLSAGGALAPE